MSTKPRIFILEDNDGERELLRIYLADHGLKDLEDYLLFATSDELLAALDETRSICVLDFRLEGEDTDGYEVAQKVKKKNKKNYIIIITGLDAKIMAVHFIGKAQAFIEKEGTAQYYEKVANEIHLARTEIQEEEAERKETEDMRAAVIDLYNRITKNLKSLEKNDERGHKELS